MQTEQKLSLWDEEKLAHDTDLSAKIHKAILLSEDLGTRESDIGAIADEYKDVFKDRDDAVYFAMLPLTDVSRREIVSRMRRDLSVSVK